MAFPNQAIDKTVLVIQPIFKHHPRIKSAIRYKHTAVVRKFEDFMNPLQDNRVLSWIVRFFFRMPNSILNESNPL